jgi:hypothetical protein
VEWEVEASAVQATPKESPAWDLVSVARSLLDVKIAVR